MFKNNLKKTWSVLLVVAASLFLVVALAMLIFDSKYFEGIRYLITAVLFFIAFSKIKSGRHSIKNETAFNLGFIFSVIGLTSAMGNAMVGLWAMGIILFSTGLFIKK